jgi:hypothetical protein
MRKESLMSNFDKFLFFKFEIMKGKEMMFNVIRMIESLLMQFFGMVFNPKYPIRTLLCQVFEINQSHMGHNVSN